MIKVDFCLPRSVRIKINSECQYKCKFCHQEGNAQASDVDSNELINALKILREKLGFYRVHFTGGEPTLYKNFAKILSKTKKLGFINALTTNGQFKIEKLPLLKKAGLDSINFSLHTLDPYAFLKMQDTSLKISQGVDWAKNCIERTTQNVITANELLPTKINCVVGSNTISSQKILEFCIQNNIKLRFLNDLRLGEVALDNIKKNLTKNNAKLIGHEITFLSSSHRLDYQIGSYKFGIKCIRQFFINSLCKNCKFKNTNKCIEGYYGIRLENQPLMVRLCLNKNGSPYVQKLDLFTKSKQLKEIQKITNSMADYLKKDSIIEEQKDKYKTVNILDL